MQQFYFDFASVYGTCWLIMLTVAVVTTSHINAGAFGMYGFPVLGLMYATWAAIRRSETGPAVADQLESLRREVASLRHSLRETSANRAPRGADG
jgi:hypothetical protein